MAHTARASMDVICPLFPGCLISRFGNIHWPSWSPDLSMCNYFLWGHLKACVYEHKPCKLEELKEAIYEQVFQINRSMIKKVYPTSKNTFRNVSLITDTTWQMLFSTLDFVKCYFNSNSNL